MPSLLLSILLFAASATQVSASCAHGTSIHPRAAGASGAIKINKFGYSGAIGPLSWSSLDAANSLCSTGRRQSPINMVEGAFRLVPASSVGITIANMPNGTEFENLGTTVEVITKGGTLNVSNKTFALKQFHFHLPSEHLDNSTSIAMEMHMVWESSAKEIAVIGVYIDLESGAGASPASPPSGSVRQRDRAPNAHARRQVGSGSFGGKSGSIPIQSAAGQAAAASTTSPAATQTAGPVPGVSSTVLENVFSKVGQIAKPGTATTTPPLDMSEIVNLLKRGSFQTYSGSLTTPPCSEGVNWMVSTQKLRVKASTFERVRDVIGFNARYPQNAPGQQNLLAMAASVRNPA